MTGVKPQGLGSAFTIVAPGQPQWQKERDFFLFRYNN